MNILGAEIPAGCDGLIIHPFGNGTERMLKNINFAANISGLDFNQHGKKHIIRAAQEGIAFTFRYGLDLLKNLNLEPEIIRAGNSNLFLSELFSEIFANICNTPIEIYNTDGAQGAARGAAFGSGFYKSMDEAFENLKIIRSYGPESHLRHRYDKYYDIWKNQLRIRLEE